MHFVMAVFGSNPETLADSARIIQDWGFDLVDLNLGCPAKRVVACNGGSGEGMRPRDTSCWRNSIR